MFIYSFIYFVSALFPDVVNCMQTDNLELKKLVYLYLMNYAKSQPDMAIMAVNTFVKVSWSVSTDVFTAFFSLSYFWTHSALEKRTKHVSLLSDKVLNVSSHQNIYIWKTLLYFSYFFFQGNIGINIFLFWNILHFILLM